MSGRDRTRRAGQASWMGLLCLAAASPGAGVAAAAKGWPEPSGNAAQEMLGK